MFSYISCPLKKEGNPLPRLTSDGYTVRAGSPTRFKVLFENHWRRVYILQFSNNGSLFINANGRKYFLNTVFQGDLEASVNIGD